ncbi:MAG: diacylglycerol/lipid kinase family protein [Huintestinicola sp.]
MFNRVYKYYNKSSFGSSILMTVYTLFSMETTDITVDFGKERKTISNVIHFVGMNLRAEGGGVPMAPDALSDDGKITFSSAAGIPKWRTFLCLSILVMAKQKWLKGFDIYPAECAAIKTEKPMILHADGEYFGQFTKIKYECLPGILKILN